MKNASSVGFVADFWLRELAKRVVERQFGDAKGSESVRLARPVCQKLDVHRRQRSFPRRPRKLFRAHAAAWAIDSAHGIFKGHRNVPYWNEFKLSRLHCVVARSRLLASGTDRTTIGPRHDGYDHASTCCQCLIPSRVLVHKALELLDTIQNSLQAHPVPNSCFGFCQISETQDEVRMRYIRSFWGFRI